MVIGRMSVVGEILFGGNTGSLGEITQPSCKNRVIRPANPYPGARVERSAPDAPSARPMDYYTIITLLTTIGFFLLAFLLLAPVYFFLKREERSSQHWTHEALDRRRRHRPPTNGKGNEEERPDH